MKKILGIVLSMLLILSISPNSFAEENGNDLSDAPYSLSLKSSGEEKEPDFFEAAFSSVDNCCDHTVPYDFIDEHYVVDNSNHDWLKELFLYDPFLIGVLESENIDLGVSYRMTYSDGVNHYDPIVNGQDMFSEEFLLLGDRDAYNRFATGPYSSMNEFVNLHFEWVLTLEPELSETEFIYMYARAILLIGRESERWLISEAEDELICEIHWNITPEEPFDDFILECNDNDHIWSDFIALDNGLVRICVECQYLDVINHIIDPCEGNDLNSNCAHPVWYTWVPPQPGCVRVCTTCQRLESYPHLGFNWINTGPGGHERTCTRCKYYESGGHNPGAWTLCCPEDHKRSCTICPRLETQPHQPRETVSPVHNGPNNNGWHSVTIRCAVSSCTFFTTSTWVCRWAPNCPLPS